MRFSKASRRDFILRFADAGGFDPDLVTEFILTAESVDGISSVTDSYGMRLICAPDGDTWVSIMYFTTSDFGASIYVDPVEFCDQLAASCRLPCECDDFLRFFSDYLDASRCPSNLCDYHSKGIFYADVGKVLTHSSEFADALAGLMIELEDIVD